MSSTLYSLRRRFPVLRPDHRVRTMLERAGFTGAELDLLARHGRIVSFSEGAPLARIGGHERRLLLLLEGSARATRADGDGSLLEGSFTNPDIVGEISVFGSRHYQVADVLAVTQVIAIEFPLSSGQLLSSSAPRLASLEAAAQARRAESRDRLGVYFEALDRVRS